MRDLQETEQPSETSCLRVVVESLPVAKPKGGGEEEVHKHGSPSTCKKARAFHLLDPHMMMHVWIQLCCSCRRCASIWIFMFSGGKHAPVQLNHIYGATDGKTWPSLKRHFSRYFGFTPTKQTLVKKSHGAPDDPKERHMRQFKGFEQSQ